MPGSQTRCADNSIEQVGRRCSGCGACASICPFGAISFERDSEGFDVPVVSEEACTGCGLCLRRCHAHTGASCRTGSVAYMGYARADDRRRSSSGGAFAAFARHAFAHKERARVYGAAFDNAGAVKHIGIDDASEISRLQGSKYVQSGTAGVYADAASALEEGRFVVFSGCPCQVAGLHAFLGTRPENLLTIDLVCHGVPSPGFWEQHVQALCEGDFRSASFRTKGYADKNRFYLEVKGRRAAARNPEQDLFFNAFMKGLDYRESCYTCPYASLQRPGDITIGDCATSELRKDYYPWEQMSFIMPNTDRGAALWREIAPSFEFCEVDIAREAAMNHQLSAPVERPSARDSFYVDLQGSGRAALEARYTVRSCGAAFALKRVIKRLVPNRVRGALVKAKASAAHRG